MESIQLQKLREHPETVAEAADWFAQKWGIPADAYRESMQDCLSQQTGVPQWYLVWNPQGNLIAGAGVIENDFHDHPQYAPNLCALFVEEPYRGQGIAGALLELARRDFAEMGCERLYLVTDHTTFYEQYGWNYLKMVKETDGEPIRMYSVPTRLE